MPRLLHPPDNYDPGSRLVVAFVAAALDAQLSELDRDIGGCSHEFFEWQLTRECNTAGMLLTHMAIVESYWVGALLYTSSDELQAEVKATLGLELSADGMPITPGGAHPANLKGRVAQEYLSLLVKTRSRTDEVLRHLLDDTLMETRVIDGETISSAWILHHLLEHSARHIGQIQLLRRLYQAKSS